MCQFTNIKQTHFSIHFYRVKSWPVFGKICSYTGPTRGIYQYCNNLTVFEVRINCLTKSRTLLLWKLCGLLLWPGCHFSVFVRGTTVSWVFRRLARDLAALGPQEANCRALIIFIDFYCQLARVPFQHPPVFQINSCWVSELPFHSVQAEAWPQTAVSARLVTSRGYVQRTWRLRAASR